MLTARISLLIVCVAFIGNSSYVYSQDATPGPNAGWPVEERCAGEQSNSNVGEIAYISDQDGAQQIYLMDADGNNQQKVTNLHGANLSDLDWSPDGKEIVFANNGDIYRLKLETMSVVQLTSNPGEDYRPVWSPDGKLIAYVSDRGGPYDVWTMKLNGANVRNMTGDPRWELTVRWLPDGSGVSYVPNSGANLQIWIDTIDELNIFMQEASDIVLHSITDFRWSPDGKFLSLQSDQGAYIVSSDSGNLWEIATRDEYVSQSAPSWSPDGCDLAFTALHGDKLVIRKINLYDGTIQSLTNGDSNDFGPVWGR